ncbi:MAG: hypothetical protein OEZ36_02415, partial [Spirochaetota bacterium]|nr:hypothetical protein [Spirochaetota bacterium]
MIYVVLIMLMALLFIGGYYILTKMKSKVVEKGKELEKEGKLEEAVNEYEKALSNESDEEVLWRLANVHEKMGKINPAIFRLKEIVKRRMYTDDVTEYKVLIKLGILLFKKNKDEESFETFLKLYKGHKQDPLILQYLIVISLGQRRCDVASALLKDLLKVDDSEPNTFFLLGICFYEREEYNQAKLMFEEASRRSETDDWRYKYLEGIS